MIEGIQPILGLSFLAIQRFLGERQIEPIR